MAKVADKYLWVEPWKIMEKGFHPDKAQVSESLFSLANEHQGIRGYFDEGYSGERLVGVYLNGIYEERFAAEPMAYKGISNRLCFMVNTVDWAYCRLELDGETLDLASSKFSNFQRELDFRSGELRREFIWETATGKQLHLSFLRLLSMDMTALACQQIRLTPLNFSDEIKVTLGLDFAVPHRMFGHSFWDVTCQNEHALLAVSKSIGHRLFAGMKVWADGKQTAVSTPTLTANQYTLKLTAKRRNRRRKSGHFTHGSRQHTVHRNSMGTGHGAAATHINQLRRYPCPKSYLLGQLLASCGHHH